MDEVKIDTDIPVIAYTRNAAHVLQNADSGPTYAVYANGSAVLTGQTFTNVTTGHYFDTCTISTGNGFAVGDLIEVKATATVDSVTDSNPLFVGKVVAAIAEDNYSRIGANGAGLTDLATAAALADVPTNSEFNARTLAAADYATATALGTVSSSVSTIESRLTSSRAGYLDNLNVGGVVASQADINALNQSASRRIILTTVGQYERPESSSTTFQIEARTYSADGAAVDADSTPTLTATGITSGSLAANLGSSTNPSTGVYRWTYSVASSATLEQIRFDLSAVISSDTQTMSVHSQVVDSVAATFTTGDRTKLEAVYDKLPSKAYITGTTNSDGDVQADEATGNFPGSVGSVVGAVGSVTAGVTVTTNNDKTGYTASTVSDKTGYALTSAYDPAKTAAQAGDAMALTTSERSSVATSVWASGTRTLTSFGSLVADAVTAIWAAASRTLTDKTGFALTSDYDAAKTAAPETAVQAIQTDIDAGLEVTLADSEDVYPADIGFTIDDTNSRDEYTVVWFRNGAAVTSGITVPTIQAIKRADGTNLIPSSVMTQIGSSGAYKYDAVTTERATPGEAVVVVVSATINAATRTWRKVVTRDVEVVA